MGQLNLPVIGQVYLDTNAVIFSVEKIEPFRSLLEPVWESSRTGNIEIISSELVLLECLVKPLRDKDSLLIQTYRDLLLGSRDVSLIPIHLGVIERASVIRAETGLKPPDAIHAATALDERAAMFLSNDRAFRRVEGLPLSVMSDSLATQ